MTILAAEAAPAARAAAPAPARPLPSPAPARPREGSQGPAGRPGPRGPAGKRERRRSPLRAPARSSPRTHTGGNYQPVILAEFIAAVLLVALTPVATGANKSATSGPSPYKGSDMIKLAALTAVYLVLALVSVKPGPGRVAAWFGGLILLAAAMNEAANVASVLDIFGPNTATGQAAQTVHRVIKGGGQGG